MSERRSRPWRAPGGGEQESCWPLLRHAGRLGLPTRIGLEDTTTGPDGQQVSGNAELVSLALVEWTAAQP
jgi:uncharacterized protein (DUF849 family)